MVLLPFSPRSKTWESAAFALRRLAEIGPHDCLDPWKLAPKLKLAVLDGRVALKSLNERDRQRLLGEDRFSWSGGVYPKPFPDGTCLCILNPTHSKRRNKVTLMEEIAHSYLNHKPSGLRVIEDGLEVREYNKAQEQEAYGVGAAALIPWLTFFPLVNSGRTIEQLADHYDVTRDLIIYRIKITGAFRVFQARQRVNGRVQPSVNS